MDSPDYFSGRQAEIRTTTGGDFTRLLRLGGRAKRKENGAKSKTKILLLMCRPLFTKSFPEGDGIRLQSKI